MANTAQDEDLSEFISPFLKSKGIAEETILVTPKEPSRNKKVYVIKKETGLTGRNYMQCSSCHQSSFRLYRSVPKAFAPDHLKYLGNSDTDLLRFCRSCWYGVTSSSPKTSHSSVRLDWGNNSRVSSYEVDKPYFERGPLGITDQRACVSWHFIQRDFVRKKASREENRGRNGVMLPLVSVIGNPGNEFVRRDYNANRFDINGKEISSHDESGYGSKGNSPINDDAVDSVSSILLNIQRDHDYAPVMQREIEVTTSVGSPVKNARGTNDLQQKNDRSTNGVRVNEKYTNKQSQCKEPTRPTANKVVKKPDLFEGRQQQSNNFITVNLPVSKIEEQLRTKREKGEGPDPNHLIGLKATAADGQTMPGLICPLCGKHTVKSYSVWKKDNAPPQIEHLFKGGVTVIRACRKCVPYPMNRDKKKSAARNGSSKHVTSNAFSKTTKNHLHSNGKRMTVNGCIVDGRNGKIGYPATASKGQVSKIEIQTSKVKKNDHVVVNVGVRLARVDVSSVVKAEKSELVRNRKQPRNSEDSDDDMIKKKAKMEEKKRKIEMEKGGELTGLECFESLQSEEKINDFNQRGLGERRRDENWLLCNEVHSDNGLANCRGRTRDKATICDSCNRSLGKTFRTIKQSKCPKRFSYFFKQNKSKRSMRICKNCTKK